MKKTGKRRNPILQAVMIVILIGAAAFLGLFAYVCIAEKTVPKPGPTDAIIVLGAQVKADGTLSVQLEYRLETALAEYMKEPRPIVSCGGQAGNEPAPEGDVMTKWLIDHGVKEEYALSETVSGDTKENIKNALLLLSDETKNVLIVTSDYHLPRALAIARDQGLDASGAGAPIKAEYWLKNHFRETLAWGKYLLLKIL